MQKFVQQSTTAVSSGANTRVINLEIPEEVIIKRIVLNVTPNSAVTNFTEAAFIASVCQNDSFNPDAGDSTDENRLVRSICGNAVSPANLDHTITMRKLAGSGISVQLENVGVSSESFVCKLTLHYLEI